MQILKTRTHYYYRATGEGYVEFGNETDANVALDYDKRSIGTRYVEVFKCPRAEMEHVLNRSAMSGGGGGVWFSLVLLPLLNLPQFVVVKMRGLPYNATQSDISVFFRGFDITPNGIHIVMNRDGRPTGEAYAELSTESQVDAAIKTKNREKIGQR
jgi:heterogeneous nuclear ribonucleoprotein F/H